MVTGDYHSCRVAIFPEYACTTEKLALNANNALNQHHSLCASVC
jgi:hypothetical protein